MMAQAAYEQYKLDEIWFMPSAKPPHKNQDEIAEKEHRKRMVQFAIDKIPQFKISNIEYKRAGKTYTYDTLVELKKEREDAHFYFIMGGDSLAQFEQWYHPEKIVKLCTILAASRDEISYEQTKEYCKQLSERLDGDFRPLKIPAMSISSHEIRKRIKKGKSIIGYCPEPVVRYIQMHRLYGDSSFVIPKNEKEQMDCLAASLRPKRFVHTLGVANMAANLAMMHDDVSLQRAKLAGLLHDCAKYLTNEEMFVLCEKLEIPLSESEKSTPAVIHGKLGAKLAVLRYGIEDDEICSAIACHTTGKSQMTTLEKIIYIADYIYDALDEKLGEDIEILKVDEISVIADYLVIANGRNQNQLNAMTDLVEEKMIEAGYKSKRIEGNKNSSWVLMDYGDVIVHVFSKEDRLFYDLERIWKDGKKISREEL